MGQREVEEQRQAQEKAEVLRRRHRPEDQAGVERFTVDLEGLSNVDPVADSSVEATVGSAAGWSVEAAVVGHDLVDESLIALTNQDLWQRAWNSTWQRYRALCVDGDHAPVMTLATQAWRALV